MESDSETSLYFYRARYYDPATGRFLGEDPINFLRGINFYRYVRNNSPNLRDPSGKLLVGAVVGAITGGVYGALGASLQCGSKKDIVIAAVFGALGGALVGSADFTEGVAILAIWIFTTGAPAASQASVALVLSGTRTLKIPWKDCHRAARCAHAAG